MKTRVPSAEVEQGRERIVLGDRPLRKPYFAKNLYTKHRRGADEMDPSYRIAGPAHHLPVQFQACGLPPLPGGTGHGSIFALDKGYFFRTLVEPAGHRQQFFCHRCLVRIQKNESQSHPLLPNGAAAFRVRPTTSGVSPQVNTTTSSRCPSSSATTGGR